MRATSWPSLRTATAGAAAFAALLTSTAPVSAQASSDTLSCNDLSRRAARLDEAAAHLLRGSQETEALASTARWQSALGVAGEAMNAGRKTAEAGCAVVDKNPVLKAACSGLEAGLFLGDFAVAAGELSVGEVGSALALSCGKAGAAVSAACKTTTGVASAWQGVASASAGDLAAGASAYADGALAIAEGHALREGMDHTAKGIGAAADAFQAARSTVTAVELIGEGAELQQKIMDMAASQREQGNKFVMAASSLRNAPCKVDAADLAELDSALGAALTTVSERTIDSGLELLSEVRKAKTEYRSGVVGANASHQSVIAVSQARGQQAQIGIYQQMAQDQAAADIAASSIVTSRPIASSSAAGQTPAPPRQPCRHGDLKGPGQDLSLPIC